MVNFRLVKWKLMGIIIRNEVENMSLCMSTRRTLATTAAYLFGVVNVNNLLSKSIWIISLSFDEFEASLCCLCFYKLVAWVFGATWESKK